MVQVRGTVHDVSDNPERVERIVVRAVEPRMHGTTYVTEESVQFPVVDGVLDFDVLPGPCVVAFLRPHGATTYEKLMVPDVDEATFSECLDAAALAEEGTRSALEKVVRQIQEELNKAAPLVDEVRTLRTEVSNHRTAVEGFVTAAQKSASDAATSQSKAKTSETNAKTSETNANTHRAAAATQANAASESASQAATARDAAKQSQTAAKTSETNAASSASASASSASSSKTQADNSAASATQAETYRDAAKTSETNAAGSAAAAKTSETNSKQSETNAGDYAAVATTAATEAVDAMERATEIAGGDFATREYVTDAVADAIADTVRVDTTTGTTIHVGDTLIFGDTGTRVLTSWDKEGNITYGTMPEGITPMPDKSGGIYIRRVGQRVTWSIICAVATASASSALIPDGFRVTHEPYPYTNLTPVKRSGAVVANVGSTRIFLSGLAIEGSIAHESSSYGSTVVWDCTQSWPTSLPGIPR